MIMQLPADGGPFYAETDLSALVAEPWNAFSSLAILLPAVYWAIKLGWDVKRYSFLYLCIPLLLLGGLGSTLYHAFRSSNLLLLLDVLPTAALMVMIGIYFWFRILQSWWQVLAITLSATILRFFLFDLMPAEMAVNSGYFLSGTVIFLPMLIYLKKCDFAYSRDVTLSLAFLCFSLFFRDLDHRVGSFLPMGSHFIWHLLSGAGAYFLGSYLYRLRKMELSQQAKATAL